jgi:hypothetical protein
MSEAKRHHYLPVSYLRRFTKDGTDRGLLWLCDISTREIRAQTPLNTAVQGYYNAIEKKDGTRDNQIEKDLSVLEGQVVPIIDNIECGAPLTRAERRKLAFFVAVQKHRAPDFEKQVEMTEEAIMGRVGRMLYADHDKAKEVFARYERETGKVLGVPPKELSEMFANRKVDVVVSRNASLQIMVNQAPQIADLLVQMEWAFFHAPDGETFVTSDQPFTLTAPPAASRTPPLGTYGILNPGCRKLFPLSPKVCLVIFDRGYGAPHRLATADQMNLINRTTAADAYRYLIGRDEATVRKLAQIMDAAFGSKWGGTKFRID